MRVAAVLVPHFAYHTEASRASLAGQDLLVAQTEGSRTTVVDFSPGLPVQVGMPLAEALGRAPNALLVEAALLHYQARWDEILDALQERSPIVESEDLGMAYVDLTGLEGLYESEAHLVKALERAVFGLPAQIGVGDGKYPASVAARQAEAGRPVAVPSDVRRFLAPVSTDWLPLSWETRVRLRSFGMHTLGDIARSPVGPLQAQFGAEGRLAWALAHGRDDRPLMARTQQETITEWLSFPAPVHVLSLLLSAAETLLARGFFRPHLRNRAVRQVALQAHVFQGAPWQKVVPFHRPQNNSDTVFRVVKSILEHETFPGPLEELSVTLSGLTGEVGEQGSLFPDARHRARLRAMMQQLEAQLGKQPPIYHVRAGEPWSPIPERRWVLVPYAL